MSTTITVYSQLPQQLSGLLSLFDLSLPRLLSGRLLRAILQAECVLSSKKDDEALLPRGEPLHTEACEACNFFDVGRRSQSVCGPFARYCR